MISNSYLSWANGSVAVPSNTVEAKAACVFLRIITCVVSHRQTSNMPYISKVVFLRLRRVHFADNEGAYSQLREC